MEFWKRIYDHLAIKMILNCIAIKFMAYLIQSKVSNNFEL